MKAPPKPLLAIVLGFWVAGCGVSTLPQQTVLLTTPSVLSVAGAAVRGLLAQSPTGEVSVVDQLPSGFSPVPGAEVRLLGGGATTSDQNGHFQLSSAEGKQRIWVTPPGVVLEVPAFSPQPAPSVTVELFPSRVQLPENHLTTVRAVGIDATGHYHPLAGDALTFTQASSELLPNIPLTSLLAKGLSTSSSAVVGGSAGESQLQVHYQGVTTGADVYSVAPACAASLSGKVLRGGTPVAGALVQVDGHPAAQMTNTQGEYTFPDLAPVFGQVHVFAGGAQVGLGQAPLSARLQSELDPGTAPASYSVGVRLSLPNAQGIGIRPSGQLLVCANNQLRLFQSNGQELTPPVVTPPATLNQPSSVAADFSGEPYVANSGSDEVLVLGTQTSVIKTPFSQPRYLAVDGGGNFYVTDSTHNQVHLFVARDDSHWQAGASFGSQQLLDPQGLAVSRDGRIYVADAGHHRIAVFELVQGNPPRLVRNDPNLAQLGTSARLVEQWPVASPRLVSLGPAGEVYVATPTGFWVSDASGHDSVFVATQEPPQGLAVDSGGNLWVALGSEVRQYLPSTPVASPTLMPTPSGRSLLDDAAFTTFERTLQQLMRNYEIAGGTFSLTVNGRLVVERGYGWARRDLQAQIPARPGQLFRLASCSKTFTATAVLLQMQQHPAILGLATRPFQPGHLLAGGASGYNLLSQGVDDNRLPNIEAQHLLQMTAGMDNPVALYSPLAKTLGGNHPPASAVEILRYTFAKLGLGSRPGDQYVYSDVAYMTLGRLVEAVTVALGNPQTYAQYCQQHLLGPLGITDMRLAQTALDQTAPNEASYYPYSGEPCGPSVFPNQTGPVPATYGAVYDGVSHDSTGGWIASSTDLVRLANALSPAGAPPGFSNPLDAQRRTWMTALPNLPNATLAHYFGMGWDFTANDQGVVQTMSKDGGLPGTSTFVKFQLQGHDQIVWAYTFNGRPGPGAKKQTNAVQQINAQIEALIQGQTGHWPAGNLFP